MPEQHQHIEAGLPDLRLPVGMFFSLVSLILLAEAVVKNPIRAGMPVDLYWGIVLLVFGALMAFFGWKAGPEKRVVEDDLK